MNVAAVEVTGTVAFPEHAGLILPERGIVLITGDNGAGKSSLCETVAWALWQRGIRVREDGRPAQPWFDGREATCAVELRGVGRIATKRSRRGALAVDVLGTIYETARKAASAVEALVGPFDVWRRACVFTSADAASFTAAGDGDRKDLIERMLGLGLFDAAVSSADMSVREATRVLAAAEGDARAAARDLAAAERALETARLSFAGEAALDLDVDVGWQRAADVGAAGVREEARQRARVSANGLAALREELAVVEAALGAARVSSGEAARDRHGAERAIAEAERGLCSACGQAIPPSLLQDLRGGLAAADRRSTAAKQLVDAAVAEREVIVAHVLAVQQAAHADERAASACLAYLDRAEHVRRSIAMLDEFTATCDRARALVEVALANVLRATMALAEQRAAREAIAGTRSATLARAAARLGSAANAALRALGSPIRLEIAPVITTRGGDVVDKIGITVFGAGNGQGYGGCSDGQKRVIDIALLFAIGELARARHPERYGTLWLDEVFLHLDADHKAAAIDLVRDLARDRCVVVVEHDAEFARGLRPDKRVFVERGRLIDG